MTILTKIGLLKPLAKGPLKQIRRNKQATAKQSMRLPVHLVALLAITWLVMMSAVSITLASETSQNVPQETSLPAATVLPPVMVNGLREPLTNAANVIDRHIIQNFPSGNGSINQILSFLPDIQFSESSNLSTQGGEILPSAVSISGGKGFENNFLIDGLSNNSLIDPDANDPLALNDVPGHAQQIFLDASLVDQITLYDSNVPASYGDFKGGVVHATTIEPADEFGGSLFYRTTRDAWTAFHIAPSQKSDFENSGKHTLQPKFEKHQAGFDIHIPVTKHIRLLAAYQLQLATIPLKNLGETQNQRRRKETFFIKLTTEPTLSSNLNLSWTYIPYEGKYFKKDYKNSDLTILGGAYMANADYRVTLPFADLHVQAGYTESENSREGPPHMILTQNPDRSWETEGFPGDIEKTQQNFQYKTDLNFHRTSTGAVSHQFNIGVDFQHIHGTSNRDRTSYVYSFYDNGTARRTVYEKHEAEATLRQYNVYAENILRYRRLELRPGLRLSYDDFMGNLNLAPRFAAALDIFGNGRTVLLTGVNRYYANNLLTYKLREEVPTTYYETRLDDGTWIFKSMSSTVTDFQSLKTPYADEFVIGIEQEVFGGKTIFKYIQRDGKNEFAKSVGDKQPDGFWHYTLNNNGRSRHESYRISWERQWHNHYLNVNGTYQETDSSNESYDDLLNDEEVWYNGQAIPKSQLPRKDFNRPWLINVLYVGQLPYNVTFSSLIKYRSGYQALQKSGKTHADLGIPIYEKTKLGGAATINCKIDWRTRTWTRQEFVLSLEILNLLNKKSASGEEDNEYELGRQFWLGAKYFF